MFSNSELKQTPEYWLETIQNEIFRQVKNYMEENNLNQTQLANKLGVSKGYISQILNGNFNFTLKKLIELSIAIGVVPDLKFKPIENKKGLQADESSNLYKVEEQYKNNFSKSIASEPNEIYRVK